MSDPDLLVAAAALALLAAGLVLGVRIGARLVVRRALAAPSAEVRRAAVRLAAHAGLGQHVKALMKHTRVEQDHGVLAALAEEVSAAAPDPDDPPLLDELRLWARSYPETGPAPRGGRRPSGRRPSWVVPVAMCNVAAVGGAAVGSGIGEGTALVVAGSVACAAGVLVAYALARTAAVRRPELGKPEPPPPAPPRPAPVALRGEEEASALTLVQDATPPLPQEEVIDLTAEGRGRVEAAPRRDRSAAETFWDVSAPEDEVKEVLDRREPSAGGRRLGSWRRPGRPR